MALISTNLLLNLDRTFPVWFTWLDRKAFLDLFDPFLCFSDFWWRSYGLDLSEYSQQLEPEPEWRNGEQRCHGRLVASLWRKCQSWSSSLNSRTYSCKLFCLSYSCLLYDSSFKFSPCVYCPEFIPSGEQFLPRFKSWAFVSPTFRCLELHPSFYQGFRILLILFCAGFNFTDCLYGRKSYHRLSK